MKEKIVKAITNIRGYNKFLKAVCKMEATSKKLRVKGEQ